MRVALTLAVGLAFGTATCAQTPPTRSVYKCVVNGRVTYTDDPCLNAAPVDVTPTRGMSQAKGADVRREEHREAFAQAIKPVTGMTPDQFNTASRRQRLAPEARADCTRLDTALPAERDPAKLLALRKRYKALAC